MVDEEAFLLRIAENPADAGPRLVYADWLEEQGRGEEGELIRCQCEAKRLIRIQNSGGILDGAIHLLNRRAGDLLNMLGCFEWVRWPPSEGTWPDWRNASQRNLKRHYLRQAQLTLLQNSPCQDISTDVTSKTDIGQLS